ncbi:MAG TPA: DUF455 family protein [Acidimicrobiales bacterium]|nr:DUF455 family protein [Acidimicrobiales bacterium]
MRKSFPVEELARDPRFVRVEMRERLADPRPRPTSADGKRNSNRLVPQRPDAPDAARALMHGIFVGEIQALEGAGRTCWDFTTGDGDDEAPFALKLDMARQCWDEARHVEISCKLSDHMGTELGEFSENTFLYEAACNPDPVLRLTGVNRALEGLAIDVFTTMKDFGDIAGDPILEFCEDWMLADEVTHVKMGSDWLRRLTLNNPERRSAALEFQGIVDKLFAIGGLRSESEESPIKLARRFRELAGFDDDEINEIARLSEEALNEADAKRREARERAQAAVTAS